MAACHGWNEDMLIPIKLLKKQGNSHKLKQMSDFMIVFIVQQIINESMARLYQILSFFLFVSLMPFCFSKDTQGESFKDKAVVIEIGEKSLSTRQSFEYIVRTIKKAEADEAKAIILSLDTPGGLAMETTDLMVKTLEPLKIPSIAYVNPMAMSAGALIAGACDVIYMAPTSSIGAAGLVSGSGEKIEEMARKKAESAFTAFTRSVVEKKGHNQALFKAMMIPAYEDITFNDKVSLKKGELLTLTQSEAVSLDENGKPLLAKGIAENIQDLLKQENLEADIHTSSPTPLEHIAMWIGLISPFLILLIVGGIYFEFKTPGFGIGGIVAITAFCLFFFGNYIAGNLAGYEMAALFILGLVLVFVEIFVIPGTLIAGVIGGALMLFALFAGMISNASWDYITTTGDWSLNSLVMLITMPLLKLGVGLFGGVIAILLMMRYFPETAIFRKIANEVISGGAIDGEAVVTAAPLDIGSKGITTTELKPNGKALVNGFSYEVYSRDGILAKGTPIRIIEKRAFDFVVERDNSPENDE